MSDPSYRTVMRRKRRYADALMFAVVVVFTVDVLHWVGVL